MELKPKLLKIYKLAGETPLQTITRIREQLPDFSDEKMTYAGRLDPLAEGVLLVLVGEECKNKNKYLGWDKEYETEFLLGVKTDTGDVMGLIESQKTPSCYSYENFNLLSGVEALRGKKNQMYPKFSSPRLCGKEEIFKEVEIKSVDLLGQKNINSAELLKIISEKITAVRGQFRQSEIIVSWKNFLVVDIQFVIIKCRIVCTSGTYIRVLADELGKNLGTVACVYSLKRTKVGEIKDSDCLRF